MKKIFGVIIIIWCTCERWSMYIIFKWLLANGRCTIKFVFCKMAKTQTFGQVKIRWLRVQLQTKREIENFPA